MSRIGKIPVPVPAGVDVTISGALVTVKGPKGSLEHHVPAPIQVAQEDGTSWCRARTTSASPARCTA